MFKLFQRKPKKYTDISAEEFAKLKDQPDHVVLDVRSKRELGEGYIPGYIQINLFSREFKKEVAKLDPSQKYLVYCRSGKRSSRACKIMADMGFSHLYNLQGGIFAWKKINQDT